jgi:hypothetical protein
MRLVCCRTSRPSVSNLPRYSQRCAQQTLPCVSSVPGITTHISMRNIHSIAVQSFASASIALIDRLNETLRVVYSAAGVPMVNVGSAFARSQTRFQRHLQIEPRPLRVSYAYVPSRGHAPLRLWATHIPTRTATKPSLMSCGHDYRMAALATAWRTTRGGLSSQRCATSTWRPSGVTLNQAMRPMPGFPIEPT